MGLMMKDVVHSKDKEHIFYLIIGKNKVVGIALIKSEILCKLLVGIYIYLCLDTIGQHLGLD